MKVLLTPKDLAVSLKLSLATISRMSANGQLPAILVSAGKRKRVYRFDEAEIETWLRERRQAPHRKACAARAIRDGIDAATRRQEFLQRVGIQKENGDGRMMTDQANGSEQGA